MDNNQKRIAAVCLVVGFLIIIVGLGFFFGAGEEKRVQRLTEPFQWEGKQGFIILKFKSNSGTFTTGDTITVTPTLAYELTGKNDPVFLINFPNSMNTTEYRKLITLEDELTTQVTEHSFTYELPLSLTYYPVSPGILAKSFDLVWTKEGNQDAVLSIVSPNSTQNKQITLTNLITIEPQEARLQLRASEQSNGLAVIVVGLSVITSVPSFMIIYDKSENINKKIDTQRKK